MGRLSKKITKEDIEKMTVEELIELKMKLYKRTDFKVIMKKSQVRNSSLKNIN